MQTEQEERIRNAAGWFGALAEWELMLVLIDVEELSRDGVDSKLRQEKFYVCTVFEQRKKLGHAFKMRKLTILFLMNNVNNNFAFNLLAVLYDAIVVSHV